MDGKRQKHTHTHIDRETQTQRQSDKEKWGWGQGYEERQRRYSEARKRDRNSLGKKRIQNTIPFHIWFIDTYTNCCSVVVARLVSQYCLDGFQNLNVRPGKKGLGDIHEIDGN